MSNKSKKTQKTTAAAAASTNAPPPPPWDGSITYDRANPNDALAQALLTGAWAAEDISMIRRVDSGGQHLWVFWGPGKVPPL